MAASSSDRSPSPGYLNSRNQVTTPMGPRPPAGTRRSRLRRLLGWILDLVGVVAHRSLLKVVLRLLLRIGGRLRLLRFRVARSVAGAGLVVDGLDAAPILRFR